MVCRIVRRALEARHNMLGRREIRVTNAKANHIDARRLHFLLQPIQFGEEVGRQEA